MARLRCNRRGKQSTPLDSNVKPRRGKQINTKLDESDNVFCKIVKAAECPYLYRNMYSNRATEKKANKVNLGPTPCTHETPAHPRTGSRSRLRPCGGCRVEPQPRRAKPRNQSTPVSLHTRSHPPSCGGSRLEPRT